MRRIHSQRGLDKSSIICSCTNRVYSHSSHFPKVTTFFFQPEMKEQVEKLITESIPPGFIKSDSESTYCDGTGRSGRCLKLTQIMPMSYLHTKAARKATCTHRNLAWVWKDIVEGQLRKVDEYLYAILRVRNHRLFVLYSTIKLVF